MYSQVEVSVVVPVFNEEKSILPFLNRLVPTLEKIGTYEIIFCLDPSADATESVIESEIQKNQSISLITFSRRFGQPSAVMAGIKNCCGRSCVVIDVDLQDPPELIASLFTKYCEGFDVVYAKRISRKGETLVKIFVSWFGYKLINAVAEIEIPTNTGDFRIMSRRVVDELCRLKEGHGFLRGLVAFVGFKQAYIEYNRDARESGDGKYNRYFGSLKIGLNGLVGFSNFLLRLTLFFGLSIALISFILAVMIVISRFSGVNYPIGIPTTITLVLFLGGIQLISIGILGEYIGRIYDEVKYRPNFIIESTNNLLKDK